LRTLRRLLLLPLALLALAGLAAPAVAHPHRSHPAEIALPNGFQPEGIEISKGGKVYVGSIPTGAIWRGNLRTGKGSVLVPGATGRAAIGLELDHRGRLFVAGGPTGRGTVYDAHTGAELASWQLTTGATFINDAVVTRDAVWFTDSVNPVLYKVAIGRHGKLGGKVTTVPLSGDIEWVAGAINANGIEVTPDGRKLIIVQTNTGRLFTVDRRTGRTRAIDLGGATVPNGDGLLLKGRTLFVVQNQLNLVAVVKLTRSGRDGDVVKRISDPDFDVPSTIADSKHRLYVVNARFGITPGPETPYNVVRVDGR
jgi:sugar lactone lactonase YvrE